MYNTYISYQMIPVFNIRTGILRIIVRCLIRWIHWSCRSVYTNGLHWQRAPPARVHAQHSTAQLRMRAQQDIHGGTSTAVGQQRSYRSSIASGPTHGDKMVGTRHGHPRHAPNRTYATRSMNVAEKREGTNTAHPAAHQTTTPRKLLLASIAGHTTAAVH